MVSGAWETATMYAGIAMNLPCAPDIGTYQ